MLKFNPTEFTIMQLEKITLMLKYIFKAIFYGFPLLIATFWITGAEPHWLFHNFNLMPEQLLPLGDPSTTTRILGFMVTLLPTIAGMLISYYFINLFDLYHQGRVFEFKNARCIRNIAIVTIGWQLVRPIYDVLISYALTYQTGIQIHVLFDVTALRNFLIGILIYIVALVMEQACKLREEQDYTI